MEPYILPIIYSIWPVDIPFPTDCDHKILYEVFIPETDYDSMETRAGEMEFLNVLEQEALRLVSVPQTRSNNNIVPSGYVYVQDSDVSAGRIPIANLPVRIKVGSKTTTVKTNTNGYFYSGISVDKTKAEIHCPMQGDGGFTITTDKDALYIVALAPAANATWTIQPTSIINWHLLHIFHASNFFHNGNHPIRKNCLGRQVKFINENGGNVFSYGPSYALIKIYNNTNSNTGMSLFGTVCHEWGHNSMAAKKGRLTMKNADERNKESWASLVGYHLTCLEYGRLGASFTTTKTGLHSKKLTQKGLCRECDLGFTHDHTKMSYTYTKTSFTQSRQFWWAWDVNVSAYTPFYVDLVDDSNQRKAYWTMSASPGSVSSGYPNDNIKNFPVSIIQDLAYEYQNLSSVADQIKKKYMGQYFTSTEWHQFIESYNSAYGWGL